jgi:hypothetical protein
MKRRSLARARAAERVNDLREVLRSLESVTADSAASGKRRVKPVQVAGRIAQTATRVLPVADRVRYGDEYRSELYELAAA